jgi:hypothetical protein
VWALGLAAGAAEPALEAALERIGTIRHPPMREASGLVASRRFEGVLWTLSDSGNAAAIYAIDRSGRLLAEYTVQEAANVDWESLAIDERGFLYIADVGNNLALPLRWVYQVAEPDPRAAPEGNAQPAAPRPLRFQQILSYRFPEEAFDVEGTFVWKDALYLISKVRKDTAVYRLPIPLAAAAPVAPGDAPSSPVPAAPKDFPPRGKLERLGAVRAVKIATGADISADGRWIAVCTYREAFVFERRGEIAEALAGQPAMRIPFQASGVEACAWQNQDLLLVSEDRSLYRLALPRPLPANATR